MSTISKGSMWFPPIRSILKPCRIVQVHRRPDRFEVIGETHLEGQPVVTWQVRTFEVRSEDSWLAVEATANDAALAFAGGIPTSFVGHVYVVDSQGRLTKVRSAEGQP